MSDELEDLARRLVVGHKRDGRSVYDETAKAELVALCGQSGASVSRLARECGINANQLSRWIREQGQQRRRKVVANAVAMREAFVPVPVSASHPADESVPPRMSLQARLPNGVAFDLREVDLRQAIELFEVLGRMRCSASTKG